MKSRTHALVLCVVAAAFFLFSCSERADRKETHPTSEEHMPAGWKFALPAGEAGEGRKLFVELECYKCHEVKGEKFPAVADGGTGTGPELSQMGGMHPPEFSAESIVNPNAVIDPGDKAKGYIGEDGKSRMPDYSGVLTVKQLSDLAAYLASLKPQPNPEHGH